MINEKTLVLDEAVTGMTLAQEVQDANGVCLVASGTVLTAAMLESLKRRGVKTIVVQEELELSEEKLEEEKQAQREAWTRSLEQRFRQVENDANMQRLKRILLAYRLQGLE